MKDTLYYKDAYIQTFTTHLIQEDYDESGKLYAVLENTAFYPTGGGQPHDTGTLNGVLVENVEEINGEIRHYITEKLQGREISGEINWKRRFDHMQQHAGQHILSAAFIEKFGIPTVAFHLGKEVSTIDIATADLSPDTAKQAEKLANEIVFQNRPITIRWVDEAEAKKLPLRKAPTVTENIRVVVIEDFDYNGCGGTHPERTGEVGPIKILGWERHKGNIRLQFVCGWRTIRTLHEKQAIVKEAVRLFNSKEEDLPVKMEQAILSQKELEKSLREANDSLFTFEAKDLLSSAKEEPFGKLISHVFTERSMQDLAKLAAIITEQDNFAVVLFVTTQDEKLQCICARGKAVEKNMNTIIKEALPLIDGKGGGNPQSARGGGKAVITGAEFVEQLISIICK
ncbi:DHHA1 domain-containing protein [Bacillus sp. 165]|uniref:alanyl-tRNA editing protein n=1 Tax=Bacillus sp. 165 TaxID=1529117 RepID=UPI001ADA9B1C|nr:DHHA1 domain-containing protein [Bacillus sp. 165]MBO9129042.1 alanyl-tRNA editing protein [Bacillus sp. 165]